jgi:DNA-binding CsgD family transcriptional regulator
MRELISEVCTPKQIEALKLKASGLGCRRIARVLDVSTTSVRDRLQGAERRIIAALEATGG